MTAPHLRTALIVLSSVSFLTFFTNCSSRNQTIQEDILANQEPLITIPQKSEAIHGDKNSQILEIEQLAENKLVKKWLDIFTGSGRERFALFLQRGEQYKSIIQYVMKKNELPEFLYYLALIESGFNVNALSSAKAMGIWQFIPGTAKRYGLRINSYVDERKDPIRATLAASQYLKGLYNVFGSWYLAIAAYNAGEARVMNVILRTKTRDYWQLAEMGVLPRETSDYAPQFVAAALIGTNPKKYGFDIPASVTTPPLSAVKAPIQVDLRKIASTLDLSMEEFKRFNPHFYSKVTPPEGAYYLIWIPADKKNKASDLFKLKTTSVFESIVEEDVQSAKKPNNASNLAEVDEPKFKTYKVRPGDNLRNLSRKFKTTVSKLKKMNALSRSKIFVGQIIKVENKNG